MKYIIENLSAIYTTKRGCVKTFRGSYFKMRSALFTHWGNATEAKRFNTQEEADQFAQSIQLKHYRLQKCH